MSENEQVKIFNENYEQIGVGSRSQVHEQGLWHETFHCWFYEIINKELIIYFQKRSSVKKDFPSQLDITAAGHLLANEAVPDGFREVQEELGIQVSQADAESLGVFTVEINLEGFIDNEFTNVFLVRKPLSLGNFYLQEEEVEGIFPVTLEQLKGIFYQRERTLQIEGVCQREGQQFSELQTFKREDFCANAYTYYERLIASFEKILENELLTLD